MNKISGILYSDQLFLSQQNSPTGHKIDDHKLGNLSLMLLSFLTNVSNSKSVKTKLEGYITWGREELRKNFNLSFRGDGNSSLSISSTAFSRTLKNLAIKGYISISRRGIQVNRKQAEDNTQNNARYLMLFSPFDCSFIKEKTEIHTALSKPSVTFTYSYLLDQFACNFRNRKLNENDAVTDVSFLFINGRNIDEIVKNTRLTRKTILADLHTLIDAGIVTLHSQKSGEIQSEFNSNFKEQYLKINSDVIRLYTDKVKLKTQNFKKAQILTEYLNNKDAFIDFYNEEQTVNNAVREETEKAIVETVNTARNSYRKHRQNGSDLRVSFNKFFAPKRVSKLQRPAEKPRPVASVIAYAEQPKFCEQVQPISSFENVSDMTDEMEFLLDNPWKIFDRSVENFC